MPFIGTQPEVGGYSVLDALTASATASYTLQKDSANFIPNTANQLLVSLNGVIQKPGSSFTVSGSTLTFSSALTSSDSIDFIIAMGEPLLIGTPSDGTVSTSKIADDAVTGAKIENNPTIAGNLTVSGTSSLTGNAIANSINLGGRSLGAGGTPLGVNFSSATTNGMQINDTNSGNLGGFVGFYSGSGAGTNRANIQNANNAGINVCVGTSGSVVFTNSGYAAANALDDYEEGTWTPAFYSVAASFSYSVQGGNYTKVGRFCFLTFRLQLSGAPGGTTSNTVSIANLPFNCSTLVGTYHGGNIGHYFGFNLAQTGILAYQTNNTGGSVELKVVGDNLGETAVVASNLNSNAQIRGHIIYQTA